VVEMLKSASSLLPYMLRYKRGLALGMGALIAKDALAALLPIILKTGVDRLTAGFRLELVLQLAAALIVVSAIKGVFQYWMRVVLIGISRDIEYDLRNDLYRRLAGLSQDFYSRFRTGDIMARATNDLNAVRMMLGPGIMYWTETSVTLILAIVVMLKTNVSMTLISLAPAPIVSLAVILFGRQIHTRFEHIQSMFSDISSRVQENLAGVRIVRAYAQEESEVSEFERLNVEYVRENIGLARLQGMFMPALQGLIGIAFLLVLWAGGSRLLRHELSLGSFVMFNTYMGMLIWPMIALGWVVNLMQRGRASLERINHLMHQEPTIKAPDNPVPVPQRAPNGLAFRHVTVDFSGRKALDKLELHVREGETLALVGHTGSGKTVLVSLIPRLFDPTEGLVQWNGTDLRRFDPEELRRFIGFVPQETFLFSATIAENIAWGVPNAARERIEWAADVAGLTPDIASFPNGLDTVVGERGLTLSGGQKQRTAIARAILRDPKVLILDDALASVDTITEERILNGLASVMRDRTTILVSHRVSTVKSADRIAVLNHGCIAEQGTHDDLLRRQGLYAELYQKQLLEEELETI
jgi:ATP-binding cassette, subfamily B, multidrug efflux pump